jgi:hypothetical protein
MSQQQNQISDTENATKRQHLRELEIYLWNAGLEGMKLTEMISKCLYVIWKEYSIVSVLHDVFLGNE